MSNPVIVTAPTIEPVSLAEAKLHLRVDDDQTSEDAAILGLIRTARELVESHTGRCLMTSTWDYYLPQFPDCGYITIPNPPLQSVTSITYTDSDNTATVWASSNYLVSTRGALGRIVPAYSVTWPSFTARPIDALVVRYVAGYGAGAGDVPEAIRHAMLLLIGHLYEHRESVASQSAGNLFVMPMGVDHLLADYWVKGF
jgi:uncharacterized phiE125 gp8 family phage protein